MTLGTYSDVRGVSRSISPVERVLPYVAAAAGVAYPVVWVTQKIAEKFKNSPRAKKFVERLEKYRTGSSYATAFGLGYACAVASPLKNILKAISRDSVRCGKSSVLPLLTGQGVIGFWVLGLLPESMGVARDFRLMLKKPKLTLEEREKEKEIYRRRVSRMRKLYVAFAAGVVAGGWQFDQSALRARAEEVARLEEEQRLEAELPQWLERGRRVLPADYDFIWYDYAMLRRDVLAAEQRLLEERAEFVRNRSVWEERIRQVLPSYNLSEDYDYNELRRMIINAEETARQTLSLEPHFQFGDPLDTGWLRSRWAEIREDDRRAAQARVERERVQRQLREERVRQRAERKRERELLVNSLVAEQRSLLEGEGGVIDKLTVAEQKGILALVVASKNAQARSSRRLSVDEAAAVRKADIAAIAAAAKPKVKITGPDGLPLVVGWDYVADQKKALELTVSQLSFIEPSHPLTAEAFAVWLKDKFSAIYQEKLNHLQLDRKHAWFKAVGDMSRLAWIRKRGKVYKWAQSSYAIPYEITTESSFESALASYNKWDATLVELMRRDQEELRRTVDQYYATSSRGRRPW